MEDSNKPYEYAVHHSEEEGKKIRKNLWKVFWILTVVTTVEVSLGLFWKQWSGDSSEFMHLGHERKSFILTIMISYSVLMIYLIYLVLTEAVLL